MTPGWQKLIVSASLNKISGRSSVDVKIKRQIPAKVCGSQNNKTTAGLSADSPDRDEANTNKDEKDFSRGCVT